MCFSLVSVIKKETGSGSCTDTNIHFDLLLNTNLGDIRFKRLVVPSNKSSFKFTLAAANERHILWALDSSNNRIGMYAIYTNSSGGVGYNAMVSASGYTVSMSGSTITFAFSTVVTPVFADMVLIGTPMTVS